MERLRRVGTKAIFKQEKGFGGGEMFAMRDAVCREKDSERLGRVMSAWARAGRVTGYSGSRGCGWRAPETANWNKSPILNANAGPFVEFPSIKHRLQSHLQ